jgi:mRNA interferase RelE/StbE
VTSERYEIRFQAAARRAVGERLPESVAAAVLEFCEAALALDPRRVGKPLFGPLAGCHGARRGTYRIVYRIDEQARVVEVLDIDHRADIYHRSLSQSGGRAELAAPMCSCFAAEETVTVRAWHFHVSVVAYILDLSGVSDLRSLEGEHTGPTK